MEPTIEISEARKQMATFGERLKKQPVICVVRHKRPAFAIVSLEYLRAVYDTLEVMTCLDAVNLLHRSREDIKAGRLHSQEDVEGDLGEASDPQSTE